jgi:hypothetical protein
MLQWSEQSAQPAQPAGQPTPSLSLATNGMLRMGQQAHSQSLPFPLNVTPHPMSSHTLTLNGSRKREQRLSSHIPPPHSHHQPQITSSPSRAWSLLQQHMVTLFCMEGDGARPPWAVGGLAREAVTAQRWASKRTLGSSAPQLLQVQQVQPPLQLQVQQVQQGVAYHQGRLQVKPVKQSCPRSTHLAPSRSNCS